MERKPNPESAYTYFVLKECKHKSFLQGDISRIITLYEKKNTVFSAYKNGSMYH